MKSWADKKQRIWLESKTKRHRTYLLVRVAQLVLEDRLPVRQALDLVRERVEGLNQLPHQLGIHIHGGHLEENRGHTLVLQAETRAVEVFWA